MNLIYCNPAFEILTGYMSEEIIGKNCRFLQGKKTDRSVSKIIREKIQNEEMFSGEILNYRKDGTSFWNHLTISPIFDENKTLCNFVGIQRDITPIVRMREAFERNVAENEAFKIAVKNLSKRVNEQEGMLREHQKKGKE